VGFFQRYPGDCRRRDSSSPIPRTARGGILQALYPGGWHRKALSWELPHVGLFKPSTGACRRWDSPSPIPGTAAGGILQALYPGDCHMWDFSSSLPGIATGGILQALTRGLPQVESSSLSRGLPYSGILLALHCNKNSTKFRTVSRYFRGATDEFNYCGNIAKLRQLYHKIRNVWKWYQ
jgi:hypothetical protein